LRGDKNVKGLLDESERVRNDKQVWHQFRAGMKIFNFIHASQPCHTGLGHILISGPEQMKPWLAHSKIDAKSGNA
jgi:hypothetical protein